MSSYVPPHGPLDDPELAAYIPFFEQRNQVFAAEKERICSTFSSLAAYANLHEVLGMHKIEGPDGAPYWRLREWMPAATTLWLTTDRVQFKRWARFVFQRLNADGLWELLVPAADLPHGTYMELRVTSPRTLGDERRIPAFATWVEQDIYTPEQWCARVYDPPEPYHMNHGPLGKALEFPRIYEAHVGMAQSSQGRSGPESWGTYQYFATTLLPRIHEAGYTAVQLMGILEHPLYKSFGYQVSNYFAPCSRFGSPDDFKRLVDAAHALDMAVILDIPHSHACPNTEQSIARYDTSPYFFADKENQWGTLSFDYSQEMTRRFLLSNCRAWMDTYCVDGFRFDAVGNMVYIDHGFGDDFSQASRCFYTADGKNRLDENGVLYLQLANTLIHEINPQAVSIAEEFSGMPGMTTSPEAAGLGFDYRFAMGIPDFWGKFVKNGSPMGTLWYEMTNHRPYERTISYVECHDQCINGKDAMIWRLMGEEMYTEMSCLHQTWKSARALALHKLMRLITFSTASHGYLNFMGNEFGHPEWLDDKFYGQRQWHLSTISHLRYGHLAAFDQAMLALVPKYPTDFAAPPNFLAVHEENQTLVYTRGNLLFAFNFHETQAQNHLRLYVAPGKYTELLSSDEVHFSGHANLSPLNNPTEHFSQPTSDPNVQTITLYLPPMVGLVLKRG